MGVRKGTAAAAAARKDIMGKGPKDHRTAARSNRKGSTVAAAAPRATVQVVVEARTPVETASTGSKEGQLGVALGRGSHRMLAGRPLRIPPWRRCCPLLTAACFTTCGV